MQHTTCLIIDDDPDDQEIFALALAEVGPDYQCSFASNATDALQQLQTNSPAPDYIFLDLNMPRINGLQCLVELKRLPATQTIPVVMYSTSSEHHFSSQAMAAGASAFVSKPSRISDLVSILKDIFSRMQEA
ncbi:Response regulator receiver domain-containing protein [Chitinophaga costaii]|uniref:Response regulator receiver domain-containing protein n=1 Tax=Chitinophaga costaii TaxID=1335309 RepID=A0A1C4FUM4_9BACT|nr:response regulator [Chitinophaga costaii]PUZ27198.1 response regulator [Chitinophaga costaii]SCC59221.1 Response regulator receiver domain-containing protein [Chitinophaga costaii]